MASRDQRTHLAGAGARHRRAGAATLLSAFITLHGIEGHEVTINIEQITSVTRGRDGESNKLLSHRVLCVIGLSDSRFVSVTDECSEVLRRINEANPQERRP